jgi:hypothetical protein
MIEVERIQEWRGQDVFDSAGAKLGKLDEVHFIAGTDDAVFATVKSGLLGRRAHVVPLTGAKVSRSNLRVAWTTEQIEAAPEAPETLDGDTARGLAGHYGLEDAEGDVTFETSTARAEREQNEAEDAKRRHELEEAAAARRSEAEEAERAHAEAGRTAEEARQAAEEARQAAERPPEAA